MKQNDLAPLILKMIASGINNNITLFLRPLQRDRPDAVVVGHCIRLTAKGVLN